MFLGKIKNRIVNKNPFASVDLPYSPVSDSFGYDRGEPVDRRYIESFISENKSLIRGDVLEIGDDQYTKKYGDSSSVRGSIFTFDETMRDREGYIVGDLTTGSNCTENTVDCFILTQTIPFMFDGFNAAKNIYRMLKQDGVALMTVPGISMISMYDYKRWGQYWGYTEQSLRMIFDFVPDDKIELKSYGNAKIAAYFLYGLAAEELKKHDFEVQDERYPIIISLKIRK